jgi:hypothetical protein
MVRRLAHQRVGVKLASRAIPLEIQRGTRRTIQASCRDLQSHTVRPPALSSLLACSTTSNPKRLIKALYSEGARLA